MQKRHSFPSTIRGLEPWPSKLPLKSGNPYLTSARTMAWVTTARQTFLFFPRCFSDFSFGKDSSNFPIEAVLVCAMDSARDTWSLSSLSTGVKPTPGTATPHRWLLISIKALPRKTMKHNNVKHHKIKLIHSNYKWLAISNLYQKYMHSAASTRWAKKPDLFERWQLSDGYP